MKLYEYEAKEIASRFGIPIPKGAVCSSADEAVEAAKAIGLPVMLKAQVLVAGRAKAGGVKRADSLEEVREFSKEIFGKSIKGERPSKLLVESLIPVRRELYVGVVVDRSKGCYALLASREGGVDIEEVAERSPGSIVKKYVDPFLGLREFEARQVAKRLGYGGRQMAELSSIVSGLYRIAMEYDMELAETNPLIEDAQGSFVAADVRAIIDDNALFRHEEFAACVGKPEGDVTELEALAKEKRLAYVDLDGDIGIIGNGAGLVMATLDLVQEYGGRPANFCDVGGGANLERIAAALEIVQAKKGVKAIFVNILGGITRCDEVAKALVEVKRRVGISKPLVIRLVGTNEEEGRRILKQEGIPFLESMDAAAELAVKLAGR